MKRVLVAGVVGLTLLLATPTLASSADRHSRGDNHHSDNRGDRDRGRHGHDGYYDGYYGPYGGPAYYYGRGYDCYHDPSGYTTCEPYGGDYDPGGYNGGYPDPPPDPQYCSHPHSAHSAQCPEEQQQPAAGDNGAPSGMVVIKDLAFNPATTNARVGQDVVWHFADNGTAHTVTADNGSFDSGKRSSGDYHIAFPKPGVYSYHCAIHSQMKGKVTVG